MVFCCSPPKTKASQNRSTKQPKPKRRNKSDLGDNFVAPDGGWGWIVCLAAGCSNLVIFPVLQQFGLIFRERLITIGMTNSQITTVINANSALSACTGLLNGPMFRRFSYRQVALVGATLMTTGLLFTSIANSFAAFILAYSVLFGFGIGISISATSVALNTYFKEKRRIASGFSWTITSAGPIIMPYFVTMLVDQYGVQGAVIIFSGIAMHSFAAGLIYQPVQWHAKKQPQNTIDETELAIKNNYKCQYCRQLTRKNTGIFSSQYLYNEDDRETPGYQITDPGTPMMARANDGWYSKASDYGSKWSLASGRSIKLNRCTSVCKDVISIAPVKETDEEAEGDDEIFKETYIENENISKPNAFNLERRNSRMIQTKDIKCMSKCTCEEERVLLNANNSEENTKAEEEKRQNMSFLRKIVVFFDLDLLKDLTFVNLMLGLTLANFAEINFSVLTPFILSDFGYATDQIAFAMSLLGGMDTSVRFLIPFFAERVGWDNQTFFMCGILGMAVGRIIISYYQSSYTVILIVFAWIGMNKALRTIFMTLVIPGYVPLKRLPAASGLQLLSMGIFSFSAGPIIGLIRDRTNYIVTLHCLNILTFTTVVSWGLQKMCCSLKNSKK